MQKTPDLITDLEMQWHFRRERRKLDKKKLLIWSVSVTIFTVGAAFLLFRFVLGIAVVQESSMVPRLHDGELILYNRLAKKIKQGDIIFFYSEGVKDNVVKRVIAVGGDRVNILDNAVIVNESKLEEPYLFGANTSCNGDTVFPLEIPEGYLFVLGDNREISLDSRSSRVGLVKESDILGKLIE